MSKTKAKEQEMEESKSNWKIKEVTKSFLGKKNTTYKIITRWFEHENSRNPVRVTRVMASTGSKETAKLIASAPDMLELLKNILVEVRPEISRVNELHDQTIFNPVATETIDMAREIINKAEGK